MDLFDYVYNQTSELVFYGVVLDYGDPIRGTRAEVRLTLSNTCLLDVLFEPIESHAEVKQDGSVRLRIPKYYVYEYGKFNTTGSIAVIHK